MIALSTAMMRPMVYWPSSELPGWASRFRVVPAPVAVPLAFRVIVPPSPEAPKVFRVSAPWLMTQLPEKPVPLAAAV